MTAKRSGSGPDDGDDVGSWACETLPLSVRRELLERELNKLGFRKARGHAASEQQQQQPQSHAQAASGSEHPQQRDDGDHGD